MNYWRDDEGKPKSHLADCSAEHTPASGLSREGAEALGTKCAPAPSTECTYSGEYWTRIIRPPNDPSDHTRYVGNIQVRFSYLKPQEIVVHESSHAAPDDE